MLVFLEREPVVGQEIVVGTLPVAEENLILWFDVFHLTIEEGNVRGLVPLFLPFRKLVEPIQIRIMAISYFVLHHALRDYIVAAKDLEP